MLFILCFSWLIDPTLQGPKSTMADWIFSIVEVKHQHSAINSASPKPWDYLVLFWHLTTLRGFVIALMVLYSWCKCWETRATDWDLVWIWSTLNYCYSFELKMETSEKSIRITNILVFEYFELFRVRGLSLDLFRVFLHSSLSQSFKHIQPTLRITDLYPWYVIDGCALLLLRLKKMCC